MKHLKTAEGWIVLNGFATAKTLEACPAGFYRCFGVNERHVQRRVQIRSSRLFLQFEPYVLLLSGENNPKITEWSLLLIDCLMAGFLLFFICNSLNCKSSSRNVFFFLIFLFFGLLFFFVCLEMQQRDHRVSACGETELRNALCDSCRNRFEMLRSLCCLTGEALSGCSLTCVVLVLSQPRVCHQGGGMNNRCSHV